MDPLTPRLDILPAAQRQLWPDLRPVQTLGYVLYGGTAIALRLGHRQSVDFDFFSSRPVDRQALRESLPFLRERERADDRPFAGARCYPNQPKQSSGYPIHRE